MTTWYLIRRPGSTGERSGNGASNETEVEKKNSKARVSKAVKLKGRTSRRTVLNKTTDLEQDYKINQINQYLVDLFK